MMEILRQWLVGITGAAMIVAMADSLTPEGTVRKIGRMVGGLVLLIAMVKPVMALDFDTMAFSNLHLEIDERQEELEKTDTELLKTIIGEKTGAYILDKAEEMGIPCRRVEVTCTVGEENVPYPSAVTIYGDFEEGQRNALSRKIEADLAIPREHQSYKSEGELP